MIAHTITVVQSMGTVEQTPSFVMTCLPATLTMTARMKANVAQSQVIVALDPSIVVTSQPYHRHQPRPKSQPFATLIMTVMKL